MFKKLLEDSVKIEMGMNTLQSRLQFLVQNYKYHNRDVNEVLSEKFEWLASLEPKLQEFSKKNEEFSGVVKEFEELQQNINTELQILIEKYNIELPGDLIVDQSVNGTSVQSDGERTPNYSSDSDNTQVDPFENVIISRIDAPDTPAFHTKRLTRVEQLKRL